MAFPTSHKTIFVLDRSPYFAQSCKQSVDYDVLSKSKTPGIIPAAPISKTMWTSSVESMIEYIRIVHDIFPTGKLIRVVTGVHSLNTWAQKDQGIQQLMLALARIGPPASKDSEEDYDVMHGLSQAVEVLCEPSERQHEDRTSLTNDASNVQNRGRIICLTAVKSEGHIRTLEGCVLDAVMQHNKLAAQTDTLIPINHCELVLIHIVPYGDESKVCEKPRREMSPVFSCMVHVTQAGRCLYNKLAQLVQYHYNLASTTVTGIPMKEEQNASSSANYDVELLHPAVAHEELVQTEMVGDEICMTYDSSLLKKLKTGHMEGLIIPSKEGLPTETVTLKWCTPKSSVVELHHCTGAYRITPVDVNSRPSSCLTNFLLGGRAVMLEQPRKSGAKVISHMLASHGGEIFIHTIAISRSILEDPPSISEGCGGRVTDYRITNFGEFMKENRLAPATPAMLNTGEELPIDRAKSHIEKMTRYWPMVISNTIIFNMQAIDPITSLIVKDKLSEEDVDKCNKAIHHIEEMGSKNEALPTATIGARGKGPKREEQYRHMWSELENLIRAHSNTSPMHEEVLKCLLECKKPSEDAKAAVSPKRAAFEKVFMKEEKIETPEAEQAWKEFDKFQRMTEREKQDMNASETKSGEGPSMKKMKLSQEESLTRQGGPQNLLAMWTSRINAIHGKRHQEIAGRLEATGNMTELYPKMKKEQEQGENTETPNATKR